MKLTTRSRYGTRMALDIAQNGAEKPVRISDIAHRQGVSVKYLEKLIRELKQAGFIRSKRGPKGGHMLAKQPEDILVGEIVRVLEGDFSLVECKSKRSACPRFEDCVTRNLWVRASDAMYDTLNEISLADLLSGIEKCESPENINPPLK
ncbi:RrF2 family transcriptional regulator [Salidesulfovibrio onnuriiensis]|uniref:RrF2 family transcriptional regulator n=1 Tax=Salidesulfovibrio onnuriiensis TaxID=2583823 RepID=UPI0011C99101|nr:RrF2 family transcriptional regulator [Salidesulfovibrio onnuriiensis]